MTRLSAERRTLAATLCPSAAVALRQGHAGAWVAQLSGVVTCEGLPRLPRLPAGGAGAAAAGAGAIRRASSPGVLLVTVVRKAPLEGVRGPQGLTGTPGLLTLHRRKAGVAARSASVPARSVEEWRRVRRGVECTSETGQHKPATRKASAGLWSGIAVCVAPPRHLRHTAYKVRQATPRGGQCTQAGHRVRLRVQYVRCGVPYRVPYGGRGLTTTGAARCAWAVCIISDDGPHRWDRRLASPATQASQEISEAAQGLGGVRPARVNAGVWRPTCRRHMHAGQSWRTAPYCTRRLSVWPSVSYPGDH